MKVKNAPKKIYLQIEDDDICNSNLENNEIHDYKEIYHDIDVTWCSERIHDSDIEYVLSPNQNFEII